MGSSHNYLRCSWSSAFAVAVGKRRNFDAVAGMLLQVCGWPLLYRLGRSSFHNDSLNKFLLIMIGIFRSSSSGSFFFCISFVACRLTVTPFFVFVHTLQLRTGSSSVSFRFPRSGSLLLSHCCCGD